MENEQLSGGMLLTGTCKICGGQFSYNLARNKRKRTICSDEICIKKAQQIAVQKQAASGYKRPSRIKGPTNQPKAKYATDCVFEEFKTSDNSDEINMKKVKNLDDLMDEFKKHGIPDADYAKWQKARTLSKASPIIIP